MLNTTIYKQLRLPHQNNHSELSFLEAFLCRYIWKQNKMLVFFKNRLSQVLYIVFLLLDLMFTCIKHTNIFQYLVNVSFSLSHIFPMNIKFHKKMTVKIHAMHDQKETLILGPNVLSKLGKENFSSNNSSDSERVAASQNDIKTFQSFYKAAR